MKDDFTLLTFVLDQVWYGINVHDVQEVVPLPELTPLADAPPFVCGIFNLRGCLVTAIDLRQRMGLGRRLWDLKNAILVVRFREGLYGLVVDEALSLITLSGQDVEPPPNLTPFRETPQGKLIIGVGKLEGRLIPIVDANRILTIIESKEADDWQKEDHGRQGGGQFNG
jgi:purine-binding chemotaxis protein CheW